MPAVDEIPRGWTIGGYGVYSNSPSALFDIPAVAGIAHILTALNITLYSSGAAVGTGVGVYSSSILVSQLNITLGTPDGTPSREAFNGSWSGQLPIPPGGDLAVWLQSPGGGYFFWDAAGYDI